MEVHTEQNEIRTGMVEGDLCVWWRRGDDIMRFYPVATVAQAKKMLDDLARRDLKDVNCPWNAGGLEVFIDGEWGEWYDDDGDGISGD